MHRFTRPPLLVAITAMAAIQVIVGFILWWADFLRGNLQGPDFFTYYAESLLLRAGGGNAAYDLGAQQHFQNLVTAQWPGQFSILPHILPPYVTLTMYPLSFLPYRTSYIIWALLQIFLAIVGIAFLIRAAGFEKLWRWYFGLLAVAFLPIFILLIQGQSDGIVLLGLGLSSYFWVRQKPGLAGLFFLLAIFKPNLLLAVPILFLVRAQARAFVVLLIGGVIMSLATLPFIGVGAWKQFLSLVVPWISNGHAGFAASGQAVFSLRGVLTLLPGGTPVLVFSLLVCLFLSGIALSWRPHRPKLDMALAVAISMALSPYQHLHDLIILLAPLLLIAGLAKSKELRWPHLGWAFIVLTYLAFDLSLLVGPFPAALSLLLLCAYLITERLSVEALGVELGEIQGKGERAKRVVVLPAYYAEKTLRDVVSRIPRNEVDRILLVDDASTDRTAELALSLGLDVIKHPSNLGYGGNQKTCYANALLMGAEVVVMLHPDGQYDPELVPALCREIEEGRGDLALGSRWLGINPAQYGMPRWKRWGNRFLTYTENLVLGLHLSEYHTGYRAYSRRFLETIPFATNSNDFVFDSQVLIQAASMKFRIAEIAAPGRYFADASSISFKVSVRYGLATLNCLGIYLLHRLGLTASWLRARKTSSSLSDH